MCLCFLIVIALVGYYMYMAELLENLQIIGISLSRLDFEVAEVEFIY